MLGRVLATTAFRVALGNAVAFALVALVVFGVLFAISRNQVLSQMSGDIAGDRRALLASVEDGGADGLRAAVETRTDAARDGQRFYLLEAADGSVLEGNLPALPVPDGWAWLTVPRRADRDAVLLVNGVGLTNGWGLMVGRSAEQLDALESTFLSAFVWTEIGTLLFGLLSGYFVSRRVLRGVQTIADVAGRIGTGEIERRIPRLAGGAEIARIGVAINLMLDRIGALTGSLRQVTDDIAHDLRTPLTRLRQHLEGAALHAGSAEELRGAVERALGETDEIIATFNALLRIAQIESGDRRGGFELVDLSTLTLRLAEAFGPDAEEAEHKLHTDITPGLRVRGDRDLLGQMLANLLGNALRHTPPGTRIGVALRAEGAGVCLAVMDDGPGIAEGERDRVQQRFVRLDASRGTPGTGLGLSLVRAVADLHDATLTLADNAPGLRAMVRFAGS